MDTKLQRAGEYCFWTGIFVELVLVIIDKSAYTNPLEGQLFRLTFVLFLLKVLMTRYTIKEYLCIGLAGVIALASYFANSKDEVVRAVILIAACKDISLNRLLKTVLWTTALGSIVLFLLSVTGIYGALSVTANFGRGAYPGIVETRYCFGMGHPNAFHGMLLMMISLVLYLYHAKMHLLQFMFLMGINVAAYLFTDSNTSFFVLTALIIGTAVLQYVSWLRENKAVYFLAVMLILFLVALSVYGSHVGMGTEGMLIYKIDAIINGRFKYAHIVENARVENWRLFAAASNDAYFDQGFIRLFYWYGIIPGIMYLLGNIYLIYQSYHARDYVLVVIIAAYAVFSIMEAHLISYYLLRNYLFLWFGYYWYQVFQKEEVQACYSWQLLGRLRQWNW